MSHQGEQLSGVGEVPEQRKVVESVDDTLSTSELIKKRREEAIARLSSPDGAATVQAARANRQGREEAARRRIRELTQPIYRDKMRALDLEGDDTHHED